MSLVFATSFAPVTIQQKIEDSDAVISGSIMKSYYAKDKSGRVITVVVLDVEKSLGLKFKQITSRKNFTAQYLGGKWQGINHKIPGSPKFSVNEKVVLLLRHSDNAFWIHHLAAGKFSKIKKEGEGFLRSSVFSKQFGVGIISFNDFEALLKKSHFKSSLSYNPSEKKVIAVQDKSKGIDRRLSTVENNHRIPSKIKNVSQNEKFNFIFLILTFLTIGALYFFIFHRGKKR